MRIEIRLVVEEKVIGAPATFSMEVQEGVPLLTVIKMCQQGASEGLAAFMKALAMEEVKAAQPGSRLVGPDGRLLN